MTDEPDPRPLRAVRADRHRPDRLVAGPRHPPRQASPRTSRSAPRTRRDAGQGPGAGLRRLQPPPTRAPASKAPTSSCSARRSALIPRLRGRSLPALRRAPSSPTSARSRSARSTDVGHHLPEGVHFVPGHPIAGTEYSGPEAGFAELFQGRCCILTPPPGADAAAVERVAALWRHAGMSVQMMGARTTTGCWRSPRTCRT